MSDIGAPQFPFPPAGNRPQVTAFVDEAEIIGTGVAIMRRHQAFRFKVANLDFRILFKDAVDGKDDVQATQPDALTLQVELFGFNNPLGTSLNAIRIGMVEALPLSLALYIESVNNDVKVLSYTIYWGADFG